VSRAAPQVPLVILPADSVAGARPQLAAAGRHALDTALAALLELCRAQRCATAPVAQTASFAPAVAALRALACVLPPPAATAESLDAPASAVHACFGVRSAPLTPSELAAQVATIVFRALADLRHAPVDVNDVAAELAAMAAMLAGLRDGGASANGAHDGLSPGTRSAYEPRGDGLERWVAVHHLYFLLNLFAAGAVGGAAAAAARSDAARATALLAEATTYVRGFSAAMVHAGAMAADYYGTVVRPTMQPPAVPVLLTGTMQVEHAAYRAALARLVEVLPQPFYALVRRDRALALARDALLEADLADVERHVCIARALVHDDRSLVQHAAAPDNAVAALRRMRDARAARYRELLRFGDLAPDREPHEALR
jgi:hypothetical protein